MSVQNIAPDVLALEFADVIDLRPGGVTVDRGVELYLTQRATRPSRVAALVGDGLETEDILPIVARVENDEALLDGLSAQERLSYNQARDAGYTEDQALAVGRWNDPALADAAAACRVANSFSGDTLVAMADGTAVPIAEVQVGDEVLAYDFDTGETVAREVTATLPHEDWLLEAHLSDGSVMSVTEDHRFWSVTDNGWVELQDLDTTDQLLTPDGAMVTVDHLDLDAGETAPAWDLTVAEEHNFFVAADTTAEPVLVHNMDVGLFCGIPVSVNTALDLLPVDALLRASSDAERVNRMLLSLSRQQRVKMLDVIAASGSDAELGATIARNASFGNTDDVFARSVGATRVALQQTPEVAFEILGNSRYIDFLVNPTTSDWLVASMRYRADLIPGPNGSWVSPGGLRYRLDPNPDFDTVVDHVLNHTRRQPDRPGLHGVFEVDRPFLVIDDAWARRGDAVAVFETKDEFDVVISRSYVVESPTRVGFVSGEDGVLAGRPDAFFIEIFVDPNDPTIILTAYPRTQP